MNHLKFLKETYFPTENSNWRHDILVALMLKTNFEIEDKSRFILV